MNTATLLEVFRRVSEQLAEMLTAKFPNDGHFEDEHQDRVKAFEGLLL